MNQRTLSRPHRVKGLTALLTTSLLMAGCTATANHAKATAATHTPPSVSNASPPAPSTVLVDPLTEITDAKDPNYIATSVYSLLHATGTGPSHYNVHIDTSTHSVRAYLVLPYPYPLQGHHRPRLLRRMRDEVQLLRRHPRQTRPPGRHPDPPGRHPLHSRRNPNTPLIQQPPFQFGTISIRHPF